MKTYRQREKQGSKVQESTKGPDETKIKVNKIISSENINMPMQLRHSVNAFVFVFQALLERTGYTLDVTTGQRKYGGPPPEDVFKGIQPGIGTEVNTLLFVCGYLRLSSFRILQNILHTGHKLLRLFTRFSYSSSGVCRKNPKRFV